MTKAAPLGQHFLANPGVADRIVAQVPPGDIPVLEIGPGHGVLTQRLLEHSPGRSLTVVEKDPRLAAELKTRWHDRLRVINTDLLACRADDLVPKGQAFLVGNIPYLISTPLLEWVLFHHQTWSGGVLMTQDEFARRLMEGSGPLSTALRTFFNLSPVMRVSPGSFNPPPKVYSRVFTLTPREIDIDVRVFHGFLKLCFHRPRRSLRNNLRSPYPPEQLDTALEQCGIPLNARAEALKDTALLALCSRLAVSS